MSINLKAGSQAELSAKSLLTEVHSIEISIPFLITLFPIVFYLNHYFSMIE